MNDCLGLMKPVGIRYSGKKGWQVMHRCEKCGTEKVNRLAVGTTQPDDQDTINKLMMGDK